MGTAWGHVPPVWGQLFFSSEHTSESITLVLEFQTGAYNTRDILFNAVTSCLEYLLVNEHAHCAVRPADHHDVYQAQAIIFDIIYAFRVAVSGARTEVQSRGPFEEPVPFRSVCFDLFPITPGALHKPTRDQRFYRTRSTWLRWFHGIRDSKHTWCSKMAAHQREKSIEEWETSHSGIKGLETKLLI